MCCRICYYPEASLYMVLVSKESGHKQWLEAEEGGDMHAAYSYALAKQAAKLKPAEMGYEVCGASLLTRSCGRLTFNSKDALVSDPAFLPFCSAFLSCPLGVSCHTALMHAAYSYALTRLPSSSQLSWAMR